MPDQNFVAGQHEAAIGALTRDMAEVKATVLRIEISLAEKRGEKRATMWIAGSVGSIVSAIVALIARRFHF
jgi:hypothetical protein